MTMQKLTVTQYKQFTQSETYRDYSTIYAIAHFSLQVMLTFVWFIAHAVTWPLLKQFKIYIYIIQLGN